MLWITIAMAYIIAVFTLIRLVRVIHVDEKEMLHNVGTDAEERAESDLNSDINKAYNEQRAQIYVKIFKNPKNRIIK